MSFFKKPYQIIGIASIFLTLLVLLGLIFLSNILSVKTPLSVYILFPIFIGVGSFLIFYYFVNKFINKEIKSIYRIISKRKTLEHKRISHKDDIFTDLSKNTEAWANNQRKQIETLEEQANFRREFLGNLAHELKTPVFSIQGFILTLLEGGLEDEKVNRIFLQKAMSGVERITNVLDDLDSISKFEFNRFNLKLTKFDIVSLVKEIFDTTFSQAKSKEVGLMFASKYDPIYVMADKGKIGQVLLNLISNSIFYGKDGGTTSIKFSKITKTTIQIDIIDDGIGIGEEHFDRLFERFYRVEKSRARNIGGSGLGLPIVKHIVEAHKQTITVNSTVGEGSVFSFTLELV